ncbi:MAG: amidase [Chloroflexi bacterium]|nr:amidase [Chloroflexota bacterium]
MDDLTLGFTPATELRRLIQRRELAPSELIESTLRRIEQINPVVNAYCTVSDEYARGAARAADRAILDGDEVGPLHGIPLAVKDLALTAGIRTTFGSRLYAENVPKVDSLDIERLRQAGAIVVGKTNTPEFGAGPNTLNALFGATRNPWNLERSAGGSSGGSAVALACGLAPLAQGSDLGGSLRIPASLCGVVGFRTSPGRVPMFPVGWTSDPFQVAGPMARTVRDVALMLSVMAGPDPRVPISLDEPGAVFEQAAEGGVKGLRIAWGADLGVGNVDREVAAIVEAACRRFVDAGCEIEPAAPEVGDIRPMVATFRALGTSAGSPELLEMAERVDNPFLREFLKRSGELSGMDVARAFNAHSRYLERIATFFSRYDLLITVSTPTAAYRVDEMFAPKVNGRAVASAIDAMTVTYAITMAGLPCISVPAGFTADGLPVGMQIVGGRHAEALVLRAAAAFEELAPWADQRPPVVQ